MGAREVAADLFGCDFCVRAYTWLICMLLLAVVVVEAGLLLLCSAIIIIDKSVSVSDLEWSPLAPVGVILPSSAMAGLPLANVDIGM